MDDIKIWILSLAIRWDHAVWSVGQDWLFEEMVYLGTSISTLGGIVGGSVLENGKCDPKMETNGSRAGGPGCSMVQSVVC